MTIQDLGSIGEVLAAFATIATLVYLAAQVRQNTRALRSSTFQAISEQMAQNVQPILLDSEVASLLLRALGEPGNFDPEERLRFHAMLSMTMRRMEAVHVQSTLGSIEPEHIQGFERSIFSTLHSAGASAWWGEAKVNFNTSFAEHVDSWLSDNASSEGYSTLVVRSPPGTAQQVVEADEL